MKIASWVATVYILTFDACRKYVICWLAFLFDTVIEPLFSKFSDIFGRKLMLMIGIGIFLLGSVLCGAAQVSIIINVRAL